MAAGASSLDEELCCSICSDFFKDPVVLKCSHSFCGVCLQNCCKGSSSRECPLCRTRFPEEDPPVNIVLRNVVQSFLKQRNEERVAEKSDTPEKTAFRCELHGQKLLLFCEDDHELLCVVCQTAKKHRNHQLCPVEEAAQDKKGDLRASLIPLKEKLDKFTNVKQECEKTVKHIKSQSQQTEKRIKEEFEKLHQFLRKEEEARLDVLRKEEVQKSQRMKKKIENISKQVSILSEKIRDIEKAMEAGDISFLKMMKDNKDKPQCSLQDPELPSGALIDVAKHLGSLNFRVWEKMLEIVQYTPVTLDPNTADRWLSVSDDLTSVTHSGVYQQLPDNPERFFPCACVLGSEGFKSGKHSWEVKVGNKTAWDVGVVAKSVSRKGVITCKPKDGFWVVSLRNGEEYEAWTSEPTRLRLKRKPQRVRVQLDYDRGEVSFFNPTDISLIYTFKDTFTGTLYPFFSPCLIEDGSNAGALKICPVLVSVTMMSSQ
ncbi:zinc-binding protein A33-like [Brienomyrus brachyistius]|uniref:zinc-binding protein A33-like n=1 Tax=Brienomyrus brachyistius TaxID=42636 RepID=UPI0020B354CB|nr:zinc-binding protein A33-like [Brienomyrus brachyistius]XP_048843403.1 zinc-binding protein A33-like [Brienomyrus brachyistius]